MGWVLFPVESMQPFDVNVLQTLERSSLELKQVLLSLTACSVPNGSVAAWHTRRWCRGNSITVGAVSVTLIARYLERRRSDRSCHTQLQFACVLR
jgi:hypothetical protein